MYVHQNQRIYPISLPVMYHYKYMTRLEGTERWTETGNDVSDDDVNERIIS